MCDTSESASDSTTAVSCWTDSRKLLSPRLFRHLYHRHRPLPSLPLLHHHHHRIVTSAVTTTLSCHLRRRPTTLSRHPLRHHHPAALSHHATAASPLPPFLLRPSGRSRRGRRHRPWPCLPAGSSDLETIMSRRVVWPRGEAAFLTADGIENVPPAAAGSPGTRCVIPAPWVGRPRRAGLKRGAQQV